MEINPIWFFDATGSIHRKINRQPKPFFYSVVCHDTNKKNIIPIAEFVTTSNNQISIANFLSEIKLRISMATTKNVYPKIIVTDMAWALINSVMRVFNNCSMIEYIVILINYFSYDFFCMHYFLYARCSQRKNNVCTKNLVLLG
jgi:hypothetical protein